MFRSVSCSLLSRCRPLLVTGHVAGRILQAEKIYLSFLSGGEVSIAMQGPLTGFGSKPQHFRYELQSGYLLLRSIEHSGISTVRYDASLNNDRLRLATDGYWNSDAGGWSQMSMYWVYNCRRLSAGSQARLNVNSSTPISP
jgi:hypothetical protein